MYVGHTYGGQCTFKVNYSILYCPRIVFCVCVPQNPLLFPPYPESNDQHHLWNDELGVEFQKCWASFPKMPQLWMLFIYSLLR